MWTQIRSTLFVKEANTSDTVAPYLDFHLSISNDIVSSKIYDKRDDFDFEIVNFQDLDGECSWLYFLWSLYLLTHSFREYI